LGSSNLMDSAYLAVKIVMLQERGALVFEPRRFVELRKKPFWKQFLSSESTGMGIFYTLNVFCIQVWPMDPADQDVPKAETIARSCYSEVLLQLCSLLLLNFWQASFAQPQCFRIYTKLSHNTNRDTSMHWHRVCCHALNVVCTKVCIGSERALFPCLHAI